MIILAIVLFGILILILAAMVVEGTQKEVERPHSYFFETLLEEKIEAQKDFVEQHDLPHFAPKNGICWRCKHQIYDKYTVEQLLYTHVTGCPHCLTSFCE